MMIELNFNWTIQKHLLIVTQVSTDWEIKSLISPAEILSTTMVKKKKKEKRPLLKGFAVLLFSPFFTHRVSSEIARAVLFHCCFFLNRCQTCWIVSPSYQSWREQQVEPLRFSVNQPLLCTYCSFALSSAHSSALTYPSLPSHPLLFSAPLSSPSVFPS